jgi:glycosyltransferase involved in cell wall biosynthesis
MPPFGRDVALAFGLVKVLMVICLPWRPELGAVRPQFEVAAELRRNGHVVDHFGLEDAVGSSVRSPAQALVAPRFARIATRRIAQIAALYDVIDANEGDLPASKPDLHFDGLLVARSNGLRSYYRAWEREARRRWPGDVGKYRVVRVVRELRALAEDRDALCAHRNADVFLALNEAEFETIAAEQLRAECVIVPHGLTAEYLESVKDQAGRDNRLAECNVSCIGTWDKRKGARDWPAIARRVLDRVPSARFTFLGVGVAPSIVRSELKDAVPPGRVSVVSHFRPQELPGLLASTTVGALASYVEGFGLATLEMLAAGIPCVVYDNPGTRASSAPLSDDYRVKPGDTMAFADQIGKVLMLRGRDYADIARSGRVFAERRTWENSAAVTLASYSAGLARLRRGVG